jgi:hypothetical protein
MRMQMRRKNSQKRLMRRSKTRMPLDPVGSDREQDQPVRPGNASMAIQTILTNLVVYPEQSVMRTTIGYSGITNRGLHGVYLSLSAYTY